MAYPLKLDVGGREYKLRAVAVHHGEDIASGHYTTYARRDGAWFHANDGDVDEVTEREALRQQAYMLWYCADEEEAAGGVGGCAAADETQRRQTMMEHVLERATEGANGRALLDIPEYVSIGRAQEAFRDAILLVHPGAEDAPDQQRSKAAAALLKAREEMLGAHGKAVDAAEAARTGRMQTLAEAANEWEKERERAPEPRAAPAMQRVEEHQCPPLRERMMPTGTSVRVAGSARRGDGRQRRRIDSAMEGGEEGGGGSVWHGEVMGVSRAVEEDYLVASCETRTWEDGYDPFTAPHGTIHVAWTNTQSWEGRRSAARARRDGRTTNGCGRRKWHGAEASQRRGWRRGDDAQRQKERGPRGGRTSWQDGRAWSRRTRQQA
jgi:hypothetical protein